MTKTESTPEFTVLDRLFRRLNKLVRKGLGESILLVDFKLRCVAEVAEAEGADLDVMEFETAKYGIFKRRLLFYRSLSGLGKLGFIWKQLQKD